MKNQIYRVDLTNYSTIDISVVDTNDLEPRREIKALGIVVFDDNGLQLDAVLEEDDLDSLIDYLDNCKRYIRAFNKQSEPIEE